VERPGCGDAVFARVPTAKEAAGEGSGRSRPLNRSHDLLATPRAAGVPVAALMRDTTRPMRALAIGNVANGGYRSCA
jgi:hypothetical protein